MNVFDASPPDPFAARRGSTAPGARQEAGHEQQRPADSAGDRWIWIVADQARRVDVRAMRVGESNADTKTSQRVEHDGDVPDPRHVVNGDVGQHQERCGQYGQSLRSCSLRVSRCAAADSHL